MNSNIARVAMALLADYTGVCLVDLESGHYEYYGTEPGYRKLELQSSGDDFFSDSQRHIREIIYEEDRDMLSAELARDSLRKRFRKGTDNLPLAYRRMIDGKPVYHAMRFLRDAADDGEYLIIAMENIDEDVRQQEAFQSLSEKHVVFTHIAESLAMQYGMIYYIDAETDEYIEFTSSDEYKKFNISPTGSDFFGTSQRNVGMVAHPADRERLFDALNKENMLKHLHENGSFTMTYQLLLATGSSYTRMSVVWANDKKHLIMGVKNIDDEIRRENALKKIVRENAVFSQIAESLANQYDTIYYVDMLNDHYREFSSTDVYKRLEVMPEGDDFFAESLKNIERVIHPDDREEIRRILHKTTLVQMLQGKHMLTHTYRLLIGEGVMYARMSIIWATDNKHMIIGVMNIDQEIRKEKEAEQKLVAANEKAFRDALTGVKNKAAYKDYEGQLQTGVVTGTVKAYAIVVCDVNGLKTVNDTLGHIEGDAYIRSASRLICNIWQHSPVFRIGGDEFVAVLQDQEYDNRYELLEQMEQQVLENKKNGKVVVAAGMAEYVPGRDTTVAQVFERADNRMYEKKAELKAL